MWGETVYGKPVGLALHSNRIHYPQQPVAVRRKRIGRLNLDARSYADASAYADASVNPVTDLDPDADANPDSSFDIDKEF